MLQARLFTRCSFLRGFHKRLKTDDGALNSVKNVLASVSRHIGAREGRRIVGEYLLTEEDVTHACTFPDAVAVGTYHLDYHWPDRVERAGTGR